MKKIITGAVAVVAAAGQIAGCGVAHSPSTAKGTQLPTATRSSLGYTTPAAPAATAPPVCDTSAWEGNNQDGLPYSMLTDLGSIQTDIQNQDQASLSSDGHQLNTDGLAALRTDRAPRCARRLRHYDFLMLFSFATAGASLYLAGIDPAKTAALNNLAAADLTKATAYQKKVENLCDHQC